MKNVRLAFALLASTALAPSLALAQVQKPPVQGDANGAVAVEEVVVTAQKRTESIVNVPIAMTAVSGQALAKAGVGDTNALAQVVPGLHMDAAGPFVQPSIRGVSTAVAGIAAEPNVALYVDGVYRPNALANDFNFVDVDSVQVLKGPQGTLFGRNSTGGAILVTTKTPSFTPHLDVTAGYGSFNTFNGSLYETGPITDKLAMSVAVGGVNSDGFRTNTLNGQNADPMHDISGRLKLLWEPTDQLKFTLSVDMFRMDDADAYAVSSYKGWSNAALFGSPQLSVGVRDQVRLTPGYSHIAEGDGVALKSQYDLGWATLTSYTSGRWDRGYENTNEMAAPFPANGTLPNTPLAQSTITDASWNYYEDTYSQEFDLSSKGNGPFDWTTGLYAFYDATTYNPFSVSLYGPFGPGGVLTGGTPDPTTFLFPASAYVNLPNQQLFKSTGIGKSFAGFADVTYNWNNWHFTIGGRYALDVAEVHYTSIPSVADGGFSGRLSNKHNFYAFTPRFVVRYSITPRSSVYASYSEGTKSGIFNASGYLAQQTPVGQERIRDVEAGYKMEAPGLRFEASAFHYDYSNLQVATYIGGAAFFQNAPSAEIYGADAHLTKSLFPGLTLDGGLAYTHSRYTDFKFAAYQFFSPVLGVVNTTKDVTGYELQRAPEFSSYLTLDYKHDLMGGVLALNATGSYQTQSYFDFANSLKQNAHGLLNLRADWTDPSAHWTVSLIGQNVTSTKYLTEVLPNAGGFGAVYARPASITGQIAYHF